MSTRFSLILFFYLTVCFHCSCFLANCQNVPKQYKPYFKWFTADDRNELQKLLDGFLQPEEIVGRSFALVAGVSKYPYLPPGACGGSGNFLKPASLDLQKLYAYLKDVEKFDEIVVLENEAVVIENFEFFLQTYFAERIKNFPKSRFLFAYSGHGITQNGNGYLLKWNAAGCNDKGHAINISMVSDLLKEVTEVAHHSLVLVNSCYSGKLIPTSFGEKVLIPKYEGAHAITAGSDGELTYAINSNQGSLFFEKVFSALEGRAGRGVDHPIVGAEDLYKYLWDQIRMETDQRQNPKKGDIYKNGSRGEFFFINREKFASKLKPWTAAVWEGISFGQEPDAQPTKPLGKRDSTSIATKTIYGLVRDDKGKPIFGAKVYTRDKSNFTETDPDGLYALNDIKPGDTLIFESPNFTSFQTIAGRDPRINAKLVAAFDPNARTIMGRVTADGNPLPGVSINMLNTIESTVSDQDGVFALTYSPEDGDRLSFSFLGYKTVEVKIDNRERINVEMKLDLTRYKTFDIGAQYGLLTSTPGFRIFGSVDDPTAPFPITSIFMDYRASQQSSFIFATVSSAIITHPDFSLDENFWWDRITISGRQYKMPDQDFKYAVLSAGAKARIRKALVIEPFVLGIGKASKSVIESLVTATSTAPNQIAWSPNVIISFKNTSFTFTPVFIGGHTLYRSGLLFRKKRVTIRVHHEKITVPKRYKKRSYEDVIVTLSLRIK